MAVEVKTTPPDLVAKTGQESRKYPTYWRSYYYVAKWESADVLRRYSIIDLSTIGSKSFEVSSALYALAPEKIEEYLAAGHYNICPESDYQEIRSKYLRFHGIKP
jgi:hypothetical protein